MIKINILTEGFVSPNGKAFLFPLIMHRQVLKDRGLEWKSFRAIDPSLFDCDLLVIDSKYYSNRWEKESKVILDEIVRMKEKVRNICYIDQTDSSCWDHARVLPIVDAYFKGQLLKNKEQYLSPMYGNRIFTDYYQNSYGINDENEEYSEPINDPSLLHKLHLSWNSGLANYTLYGPYFMELYRYVPWKVLLKFRGIPIKEKGNRSVMVSCRMGTTYSRKSIAFQRLKIQEVLKGKIQTNKLSRRRYFAEIADSKVVMSPFGFGEITLKDFEVFLTGGLLVKPDMSHMETWPNFYRDGDTIVTHDWDISDLDTLLDRIQENYLWHRDIARNGQVEYEKYTVGKHSGEIFSKHFEEMIGKVLG